jgi:mRNA interferase HigB
MRPPAGPQAESNTRVHPAAHSGSGRVVGFQIPVRTAVLPPRVLFLSEAGRQSLPLPLSRFAIILRVGRSSRLIGYCVRIISKKRLEQFWESRKGDSAIAERDFTAWLKLAKGANWSNFGSLKQTFRSADQVGNCVVFDVGNKRWRLITRVNYQSGIIFILKPLDHSEFDKSHWVDDCGCHQPAPKRPATAKKATSNGTEQQRRKTR